MDDAQSRLKSAIAVRRPSKDREYPRAASFGLSGSALTLIFAGLAVLGLSSVAQAGPRQTHRVIIRSDTVFLNPVGGTDLSSGD